MDILKGVSYACPPSMKALFDSNNKWYFWWSILCFIFIPITYLYIPLWRFVMCSVNITHIMEVKQQLQIIKDDPYLQPFEVLPLSCRITSWGLGSLSIRGWGSFKASMDWIISRRAIGAMEFIRRGKSLCIGNGRLRLSIFPYLGSSMGGNGVSLLPRR